MLFNLLLCLICDSCFAVIPFQVIAVVSALLLHVIAVIAVVSALLLHVIAVITVVSVLLFHE